MGVCVCVFEPGPSLIGALKKDWASPSSIALSWQQPEQAALPILEYEIKYYEKVKFPHLMNSRSTCTTVLHHPNRCALLPPNRNTSN